MLFDRRVMLSMRPETFLVLSMWGMIPQFLASVNTLPTVPRNSSREVRALARPRCTYRVLVLEKPIRYEPCVLDASHRGKCRPAQIDGTLRASESDGGLADA